MEIMSVLGPEGTVHLDQVADFSFSFEHLVKILVTRLDAVNDRVEKVEEQLNRENTSLRRQVETLTYNIQGFSDKSELVSAEVKSLAEYRAQLETIEKSRDVVIKKEVKTPTLKTPTLTTRADGTVRNKRAFDRWLWAKSQIKYNNYVKKMDLGGHKHGASRSLGSRMEKMESSVDDLLFKLERLGTGGGDSSDLKDDLRGLSKSLEAVEEKREENERDQRGKNEEFAEWQAAQAAQLAEVAESAERGFEMATALQDSKSEEASREASLESGLPATLDQLAESAKDALLAAEGPALRKNPTGQNLRDFCRGLEDALPALQASATAPLKEQVRLLEAVALPVHRLLERSEDGVILPLTEVPCRSGRRTFHADLIGVYAHLVAILRSVVNPGVVALRVGAVEGDLTGLPLLDTRVCELQKTQVDFEARHVEEAGLLPELERRLNRASSESMLGELAVLTASLQSKREEAAREVEQALEAKASSAEFEETLAKFQRQLAHLQTSKLNRDQINSLLGGKVDRDEMTALAAHLQDDEGENFSVASKFRCLSCDRPLKKPPTISETYDDFDSLPLPPRTLVVEEEDDDDFKLTSLGKGKTEAQARLVAQKSRH